MTHNNATVEKTTESDETTVDPLPGFDHEPDCAVCDGTRTRNGTNDVTCFAGVILPEKTEATA